MSVRVQLSHKRVKLNYGRTAEGMYDRQYDPTLSFLLLLVGNESTGNENKSNG